MQIMELYILPGISTGLREQNTDISNSQQLKVSYPDDDNGAVRPGCVSMTLNSSWMECRDGKRTPFC